MKKVTSLISIFLIAVSVLGQWNQTGNNNSSGDLTIGNINNNTYSKIVLRGPNQPLGIESKRDLIFDFYYAGKSILRSYRGSSWDTYMQLITTNSANQEVLSMHLNGNGKVGLGTDSPTAHLHLNVPSISGVEKAFKVQISDAVSDYFQIQNGTGVHNQFIPRLLGYRESDNRTVMGLSAEVPDANDTGSNPMLAFDARRVGGKILNRPLFQWNSYTTNYMTMSATGALGIGTTSPNGKLEVRGSINYSLNDQVKTIVHTSGDGNSYFNYIGGASNSRIGFQIDGSSKMSIMNNGDIGIGTIPSAKLDVNGDIKAHEIEVTLASIDDMQLNGTLAANNITYTANGNTADFVFEENYQLKDLSEVEAFIKANKHLPEIPSAAEMEEAGVNLAEMNKLLLMKVEELTLYSIELEKKVMEERKERRGELVQALKTEEEKRKVLEGRLNQMEKILIDLKK